MLRSLLLTLVVATGVVHADTISYTVNMYPANSPYGSLPKFDQSLGTATSLTVYLTGTELISGPLPVPSADTQMGGLFVLSYPEFPDEPDGPFLNAPNLSYELNPIEAVNQVVISGTYSDPSYDQGPLTESINQGTFYTLFEFVSTPNINPSITVPSMPDGLSGTVTYEYTPNATPVPEPSAFALISIGILGAAGVVRRRLSLY